MKGFITALGVIGAAAMFAVCALVELVSRLAPLLIAIGIAWVVFAVMRARRRRIHDDDRLQQQWAQARRLGAARPPAQPAAPARYTRHYERFYVVRGDDTRFAADRDDGYLNVCAPALPPAVAHQPHVPALRHYRRRPRRPSRRP